MCVCVCEESLINANVDVVAKSKRQSVHTIWLSFLYANATAIHAKQRLKLVCGPDTSIPFHSCLNSHLACCLQFPHNKAMYCRNVEGPSCPGTPDIWWNSPRGNFLSGLLLHKSRLEPFWMTKQQKQRKWFIKKEEEGISQSRGDGGISKGEWREMKFVRAVTWKMVSCMDEYWTAQKGLVIEGWVYFRSKSQVWSAVSWMSNWCGGLWTLHGEIRISPSLNSCSLFKDIL